MPLETSRRMTRALSPISSRRKVSAPSKRMMATESETKGNSNSPSNASGRTQSSTGPTTMPASKSSKMAGCCTRQASHWQTSESSRTAENTRARSMRGRVNGQTVKQGNALYHDPQSASMARFFMGARLRRPHEKPDGDDGNGAGAMNRALCGYIQGWGINGAR